MKLSNKIKKITGSLIILSVVIMPFSSLLQIQKVEAAGILGNIDVSNSGINASGLVPLMSKLPGCQAAIGKGIKNLFSKNSSSIIEDNGDGDPATVEDMSSELDQAANEADSIPVNNKAVLDELKSQGKDITDIKKSDSAVNKNQNCLNSIGKAIIKLLIQKLTASIVNWIQTGNSGEPLFLTDPSKFFKNIEKQQIIGFSSELDDSTKYPFAKNFMQGVANSFNSTFQSNATYSLDKLIAQTNPNCQDASGKASSCSLAFNADFSQGGWGAWEALTQIPANNPLGFQLMASNELATRLDGTSESPAQTIKDQLQQSGGFLDVQVCDDPWGVTKQEDAAAIKAGVSLDGSQAFTTAQENDDSFWNGAIPRRCKKWENTTPGGVVGHALTKSMDNSDNALLSAETLNDAIAALIDATTARISSETTGIINKGLAKLPSDASDYQGDASQAGSSNSQTQNDYTTSQISASTWLQQNSSFNIRTDLNQALVDQQQTYIDKLYSLDDTLGNLIKWIRQLDYCIPGPNPDYETSASSSISGAGDPTQKKEWWDSAVATTAASMLGGAGSITGGLIGGKSSTIGGPIGGMIGTVVGAGFSIVSSIANRNDTSATFAKYIQDILGVNIYSKQDQVTDTASLNGLLNNVLNSYSSVINRVYFTAGINSGNVDTSTYMPPVTLEARSEWQKIAGYQQMVSNSAPKLVTMQSTINRLKAVKIAVDSLNNDLANGTVKDDNGDIASDQQAQYEINLAPYKSSFAGLSANLVSGDDIAGINDLINQAVSEQSYVKNNLLEEPGDGCEPFLEHLWKTDKTTYNKYVDREPYPLEIDHLYPYFDSYTYQNDVDPYTNTIPWNSTNLKKALIPVGGYDEAWNEIRQGFLYGSTYYNTTSAAHDMSCELSSKWIDNVSLTATGAGLNGNGNTDSGDIGGLQTGKVSYSNRCGVVLKFERRFNIY